MATKARLSTGQPVCKPKPPKYAPYALYRLTALQLLSSLCLWASLSGFAAVAGQTQKYSMTRMLARRVNHESVTLWWSAAASAAIAAQRVQECDLLMCMQYAATAFASPCNRSTGATVTEQYDCCCIQSLIGHTYHSNTLVNDFTCYWNLLFFIYIPTNSSLREECL